MVIVPKKPPRRQRRKAKERTRRLLRQRQRRILDRIAHRPGLESDQPMMTATNIHYAYLNLRKNVGEWIRVKAMPPEMAGLSTAAWYDLGYLFLALTLAALAVRHARRPLAVLPESGLGRGQLLYLVLLWWLVVGNRLIFPWTIRR